MKNKKIIRKFTVLLAALVIMCGFSVTAYAGGGDESDDTPTPVTEETPAPAYTSPYTEQIAAQKAKNDETVGWINRRAAMSRSPLPRTGICPLWTI